MSTLSFWYSQASDHETIGNQGKRNKPGEDIMVGRKWFYEELEHEAELNFDSLYEKCEGRIFFVKDCGAEACGNAACCSSIGENSHIYFLPEELEFQLSMKPGIPFRPISPNSEDRYHCNDNSHCIYEKRPIDCRSYPYFPAVKDSTHIGYFDCRGAHQCPLRPEVELKDHLKRIHVWWTDLLKSKKILIWTEEIGRQLSRYPVVDLP